MFSCILGNMSNRNLDGELTGEETSDVDEKNLPPTYIVIQLASNIPLNTLRWLIEKIRGKKRDGAGELIVMKQPVNPEDVSRYFRQKKYKQC